jgi:uncharacterized protein (TIGR03086 family)
MDPFERLAQQVDVVALDAQATRTSIELVNQLTDADLTAPTPCGAWTLRELLVHMIAQHNGFASAAAGGTELEPWALQPLGNAPIETYKQSAERVLAAFAAENVLDRRFSLPEFSTKMTFSAAMGIGAHFIDHVVHSWDLAKTLGVTVDFEPELLKTALTVAENVPAGETRLAPGAAFGPVVTWSGGSDLDQIVALLGRSPGWPH